MKYWKWFQAVEYQGKWIIFNGYAEMKKENLSLTGTLYQGEPGDVEKETPYQFLSAKIEDEGDVEAIISSKKDTDVGNHEFVLYGRIFEGDSFEDGIRTNAVLTDGTTILGLAFGPKSNDSEFFKGLA